MYLICHISIILKIKNKNKKIINNNNNKRRRKKKLRGGQTTPKAIGGFDTLIWLLGSCQTTLWPLEMVRPLINGQIGVSKLSLTI
jgi:hypothetical protein